MTGKEVLQAPKVETGVHVFEHQHNGDYAEYLPHAADNAAQTALSDVVNAYYRKAKIAQKLEDGFKKPSEPFEILVPASYDPQEFAERVGQTVLRLYSPHLMIVDLEEATQNFKVSLEAERTMLRVEEDYSLGFVFGLQKPDFEWRLDDPAHQRIHTCLGRFALPAAYLPVKNSQALISNLENFATVTTSSARLIDDSTIVTTG